MKTLFTKKEQVVRMWHLVDCESQTLGRVATRIAKLLMGKHKASYTPNTDMGDYVVVINSDKIKLTGNKLLAKMYYRHSNYPGGFREERAEDDTRGDPEAIGAGPRGVGEAVEEVRLEQAVRDQDGSLDAPEGRAVSAGETGGGRSHASLRRNVAEAPGGCAYRRIEAAFAVVTYSPRGQWR